MKARIEDRVVYSPYLDIDIPVCSFYSLAKELLQKNPDSVALIDGALSLTRRELLAHLERYAVGFRRHGVLPGDRVCVLLTNTVENLVAMYGCVLAGATIVMAKTSLTEHEIRHELEDSDSTHVLTDAQFAEKVTKAAASLKIKGLFAMGAAANFVSATEFSTLDELEFRECPVLDPKTTVLAIAYTSGSTGLPKGAEITHYNFVGCSYTSRDHLSWSEEDVQFCATPITHISGMVFSIMAVLNGAKCAIVPSTLTPLEIMDAIDRYKATTMMTFPTFLHSMVREMRRTGRGLPTMRHICVGGTLLTEWLADAVRSSFDNLRTLQNLYGMTESCVFITAQPKDADITKRGNDIGLPAVTVTLKVVDFVTREKLGPNELGEICFRNASMVRSYYKRSKESADLFDIDGWMKTGDAGYYDEDGRLYFAERLKQMIKCMDKQVVPAELEDLLLRKHAEEIAQVCVVGLPHAEYGEAPAAAVVLTEKGRQLELSGLSDKIKATVTNHLAEHKHLYGGVFFVDSFPTTETSKINRAELARSLIRAQ